MNTDAAVELDYGFFSALNCYPQQVKEYLKLFTNLFLSAELRHCEMSPIMSVILFWLLKLSYVTVTSFRNGAPMSPIDVCLYSVIFLLFSSMAFSSSPWYLITKHYFSG